MRVLKLKLSNVGRFIGENEIDFSSKSNLIQVDAENKNTGGSSGGGKSTIFNSIEYVLGINDIPSTVLQSRLTKNSMSVELTLEQDQKIYTVTRNKSEGLTISGPDVQVSGSNKEAEDALDRLLGIPRNLIRPMIHKRQGEGGFFLSMTPKQSHEFLMDCLGMKSLEEKSEKIDAQIKLLEKELLVKKTTLESSQSALEATKSVFSELIEPKCDVDETVLAALEARIKEIGSHVATVENELRQKLFELEQRAPKLSQIDVPQDLVSKHKELDAALSEYRTVAEKSERAAIESSRAMDRMSRDIESFKYEATKKPGFEEELGSIKADIVRAMKKTCPTCSQEVAAEAVMDGIVASLVEKGKKKKAAIEAVAAMEAKIPEVESLILEESKKHQLHALSHLNAKADATTTEKLILDLKTQIESFTLKAREEYGAQLGRHAQDRTAIEAEYRDKISAMRQHLAAYEAGYFTGKASLESYKAARLGYEKQKAAFSEKLQTLKGSVDRLEQEVPSLEKSAVVAKDALRLIKSYANQLFQDSLAVVAENATKILSRIPNMNTATITFDAFKETKSGAVKEEITAILSLDGEIGIPVKSISGGERASVDLAIDLAVIDMIESKTGKGLDLFILDEPFDGLDAICRENCLEVLKSHVSSRKIVIVDHSTETKQMVQDKILVIRDGQTSTISDTL